eukprot:TRINITY_DN19813_c0_g1_i2.p1 TRINITY_DN19813_c0_g1~~TRINITY_DN19813_c0_g1_i2.p1  ORF type:complete len:253 (+),score=-24.53 TRINITY_DN19813_c0_g1_i2:102-860(+)
MESQNVHTTTLKNNLICTLASYRGIAYEGRCQLGGSATKNRSSLRCSPTLLWQQGHQWVLSHRQLPGVRKQHTPTMVTAAAITAALLRDDRMSVSPKNPHAGHLNGAGVSPKNVPPSACPPGCPNTALSGRTPSSYGVPRTKHSVPRCVKPAGGCCDAIACATPAVVTGPATKTAAAAGAKDGDDGVVESRNRKCASVGGSGEYKSDGRSVESRRAPSSDCGNAPMVGCGERGLILCCDENRMDVERVEREL